LVDYKEKAKQCFPTKEQKFIRNAVLYYQYNSECIDTSSKLFMLEAMNAFKGRYESIITATNFKIPRQKYEMNSTFFLVNQHVFYM